MINMKISKRIYLFCFCSFLCFHVLGQSAKRISPNERQISRYLKIIDRDNVSAIILSTHQNRKGVKVKNKLDFVSTLPDDRIPVKIVCRGDGIRFARCVGDWFKP